jgi:hypothetical protein
MRSNLMHRMSVLPFGIDHYKITARAIKLPHCQFEQNRAKTQLSRRAGPDYFGGADKIAGARPRPKRGGACAAGTHCGGSASRRGSR